VLFAAGCGEGSDDVAGDAPAVDLTISLDIDGAGGEQPQEAELVCPDGGPDACATAARLTPADFDPVKPAQACTEIYGGPDLATIEGELDGEGVSGTFDRSNGCEIDRFGAVRPLLQALFPDYEPGGALQP
jgi:hypothetical protein